MKGRIVKLFLVFFIGNISNLFAQYGNEWIDYNKSYYKIPIAKNGIYRMSYQTLADAGVPVNAIDAKNFILYHRGVEQAIYVENTGASQLEPGEFIEFMGQKNDGTIDANLYKPSTGQPHKYFNLYSDTTVYFLSWNTVGNGKRMAFFQEANIDNLIAELSYLNERLTLHTDNYSLGSTQLKYISQSVFDTGEGWTGAMVREGKFTDYIITGLGGGVPADGDPSLELQIVGRGEQTDHDFKVSVGPAGGFLRELGSYTLSLFNFITINEPLLWSDISAGGEMTLRIEVLVNSSTAKSNVSPSFMKVTYPQLFDMAGTTEMYFNTREEAIGKIYLELINTPVNARVYDITDPTAVVRIGYTGVTTEIKAIIDQSTTTRKLFVTSEVPILPEPSVEKVSFRNIDPSKGNYIIITHPVLMKPSGEHLNAIKAYANYRASAAGGGYDTLTVSIPDLFNQYSFGENTPLAIFNFMRRMVDQGNPEYLFLIGKALDIRHAFHRKESTLFSFHDLVPTSGSPPSDALYTAGLNGSEFEAAVATGRLSASTPDDVINYLNKIIEKESQPFDNLWQKEVLHLSGGTSAFEKVQFESIVNGFGNIAKEIHLGGDVSTVTKNTTNTVEFINISDEVNSGKSLITFFGHSAEFITDIDIGFVTNPVLGYNNPGKYPSFLINGCNSGDFFNDYINWGADWILAKDLGAVGFIANSSFGFVNALKLYSDKFYETGYGDSLFITKSVGLIQQEAARRYEAITLPSSLHSAQVQQMILNGDPAVRLFGTNIPDFETNDNHVFTSSIDGDPISSTTYLFNLNIITRNFGAAINDSLSVAVTRTFSDGTKFNYDTLNFKSVYFKDTLVFEVDNEYENSAGINRFEITINADRNIDELSTINNTAFFKIVIPLNGTINLLPHNYGIKGAQPVTLISQASDLLTGETTYLFESDTTPTYNSPFKQQTSIQGKELAEWKISVPQEDSIVYYWRTKFSQPMPGEEDEWEESSFTFINGDTEGWAQIEFPQFKNSGMEGIIADSINELWKFEENEIALFIKTYGENNPDFTYEDVIVEIDGLNYIFPGRLCRDNTINAIAFDKSTAVPYAALFEGIFSPRTCGRQIQAINNYTEAEVLGSGNYLVNYIDALQLKDHAALFTIGRVNYSNWTTEIFDKLGEIGVDGADIQVLTDGEPVIIFGRKGDAPGSAQVIVADKSSTTPVDEQEIQFNKQVPGKFTKGTISSTKVGPATNWNSLFTEVKSKDIHGSENYYFDVFGLKNDGTETSLLMNVGTGTTDISTIDAVTFPRLRLEAILEDSTNLTVPQLTKWIVSYSTPPEGILLYLGDTARISVGEGNPVDLNFTFSNVSQKDFKDSLFVKYSSFNLSTREKSEDSLKIKPVLTGDISAFSIRIQTIGKVGLNDVDVIVNPGIEVEQSYSNNLIHFMSLIEVTADGTNPIVDVTIDGEHIFDGDIVSPSPFINVKVRDSNPYLLLQDTSIVDIFVTRPCEVCGPDRISYSDPALTWSASDGKEPFTLEYNPQELVNGIYLLEVQAKDASGNKAGDEPYQVHFEVINESTVTNFYPYPNPFSSSTRFIFTLTGNVIPDEIKIQIMTISGKIVREITQDELGPIRIGNNVSEYAWDGRDEYGDQLANGAYLYRVIIRSGGHNIDMRESAGDRAFKNGFGKLYLLR